MTINLIFRPLRGSGAEWRGGLMSDRRLFVNRRLWLWAGQRDGFQTYNRVESVSSAVSDKHTASHMCHVTVSAFSSLHCYREWAREGKKIISDWNRRFVENSQKYSCQLKTNKPVFLKQHSHWSMIMTALWTAGRHQCLSIFPGADLNLNLK